jgi:hypothetical protein
MTKPAKNGKPTKKKITATHHYERPGFGVTVRTVVDTSGKARPTNSEDESLMREIANDILRDIEKVKKESK